MEASNRRVIILCAGEAKRWENHLGVPKHLINVDGETLIERTVRLTKRYAPDAEIFIVANEDTYQVAGATLYKPTLNPDNLEADNWLSSMPIWSKEHRTYLIFGDIFFTEEAMERIFVYKPAKEWQVYGREHGSDFTGKIWEEWFCLSFLPENHKLIEETLYTIREQRKNGEIKKAGGWEFYRTLKKSDTENHFIEIDDFTEDFDFPRDYDEWYARYESHKRGVKYLHILIATPTMGDVSIQFAHSLLAMVLKTKEKYPECKIAMATTIRKMHHRARTELAEAFLQTDCTHILWLDDDNIPREDDLITLIEDNLPLVSGLYFRRVEPFEPIIMVKRENGRGTDRKPDIYREGKKGLYKIQSTGMGFMLVKRQVIYEVRRLGTNMFDVRGGIGEDVWFCVQVSGAGYDIWLDTRVEVGHLGEKLMVTAKTYDTFYKNKIMDLIEKAKLIDGWMSESELHYLAEMAANSNFVIEVGSYKGRSSTVLSNARRLVCVDRWNGKVICGAEPDGVNVSDEVYKEFVLNTAGYKNVQHLKGESVALAESFPDNCADMVFIDGGHEYEQVKADIEAYWSKVGGGGRMAFHDYTYPKFGVKQAVDEFVAKQGAFVTARQIPGGSIFEIIKA